MSTPTEFYLFQALPRELRLRIWGFAISIPRKINLRTFLPGAPRATKSFTSSDRPPALLHVCHESRLEALRTYKPFFQTKSSPKYIYVAFSQDTIKISGNDLRFLGSVELQSIQKMAISVDIPACFGYSYFGYSVLDILKKMQPNLTELELLIEQGNLHNGETYLQRVKGVILDAMAMDSDWRMPDVKFVDRKTGKPIGRILG